MNRSESIDNTCPVCHDVIEIHAIGPCDHPVCFRCSTRMRVLCETADCPICRSLMPQVAFVHQRTVFREINLRDCIPNRKNKIFYEDEDIEERYLNLLEFRCRLCPNRKNDKTFVLLQTHMRREHQLFACDLCLSHLKIFPYERKFYDRKNLALHRRLGDPDDKSYKGHPLCEFCDVRYNDKDELMKHLRKDHYFCHFCDQQGSNAYYNEYSDLKQHFADSHFLCTEDVCGDPHTQFTHAFATDIDLKAHKATMHNKNMSKLQSREARHIEVDFQLHPRRQFHGGRGAMNGDAYEDTHRGGRGGDRYSQRRQQREDPHLARALAESLETANAARANPPVPERVPDPVHDFPTLNGAPAAPVQTPPQQSKPHNALPTEDFPSLSVARTHGPTPQTQSNSKAYASVMNFQAKPETSPKLSSREKGESKPITLGSVPSKTKERWASHAPKVTEENFPSLGGRDVSFSSNSSNLAFTSGWSNAQPVRTEVESQVNVISNKPFLEDKSKNIKVKSARNLEKSIGDENEFPSLGGVSRDSSTLSQAKWTTTKSTKKTLSQPRAPKVDDESFELPESYYKTYDPNEVANNDKSAEKADNKTLKKEAKAPIINKSKDFPSLPVKNTAEKKKEKKQEPKVEKASTPKSKKSWAGLSSLSDIAQDLVVSGDNSRQIFNDKTNKRSSQANKTLKTSEKKQDWFDNPCTVNASKEQVNSKKQSTSNEDASSSIESPVVIDNSFPSLHTMSTPIQDTRAPPGFSSSHQQTLASHVSTVPPGFSKSFTAPPGFSVIRNPSPYIQPAGFSARNHQLIQEIHGCLSTIEDGFQNFKSLAGQYRQGQLEGREYYVKCQKLMGEDDFMKVFPELIALLPDVAKQEELWAVYQTTVNGKGEKSRGVNQAQSLDKQLTTISPCTICGQIVLSKDEQHHKLQHVEERDFPSLGDVSGKGKKGKEIREPGSSVKGAWIKAK